VKKVKKIVWHNILDLYDYSTTTKEPHFIVELDEDEAAKLRRHYKKRSGGRSRTRDAMLAFKDEIFAILMESEVK
jgi:hypothetical protein